MIPNPSVFSVLLRAYQPCPSFGTECDVMRWNPAAGHVPRGFCGATGALDDVELILVCAEPGDPHPTETHAATGSAEDQLRSACAYAYSCFKDGKDLFHRNIRSILDLAFPGTPFDEQLRRTWITDSVKCSAPKECGAVPARVAHACRTQYLEQELALFPKALVVCLGRKAAARLAGHPGILVVAAAAPPFGATKVAKATWAAIPPALQARRADRAGSMVLRATRHDHKVHPLPAARAIVPIHEGYSLSAFQRIVRGFVPESMDDRWFVYYEEPWLYLHRSWTGYCVYQARFEHSNNQMRVAEALVNRDTFQYSETDPDRDAQLLAELMDWLSQADDQRGH